MAVAQLSGPIPKSALQPHPAAPTANAAEHGAKRALMPAPSLAGQEEASSTDQAKEGHDAAIL